MTDQQRTYDNQAMQALSDAGAQCGNCGDEPGDRKCQDCERCYQRYVKALREAGWVPRTEVLREAADWLTKKYGVTNHAASDLRRLAGEAGDAR